MIAKIHNLKSGNTIERELTAEEIAAMEEAEANPPVSEPTTEERLAALEEELAAAKILLGVE